MKEKSKEKGEKKEISKSKKWKILILKTFLASLLLNVFLSFLFLILENFQSLEITSNH